MFFPHYRVKFELYILNDQTYTDYEIGKCLTESKDIDALWDDCRAIASEIAEELYKQIHGQYKCIINVALMYYKAGNPSDGYEYDMDYEYFVESLSVSDYFNG